MAAMEDAWKQVEREHNGVHTFFGIEKGEEDRQEALQRIFARGDVSGVLFEFEGTPPFCAELYAHDDDAHHCADVSVGTVWRNDRWPMAEEIAAAVAAWGVAPPMRISPRT